MPGPIAAGASGSTSPMKAPPTPPMVLRPAPFPALPIATAISSPAMSRRSTASGRAAVAPEPDCDRGAPAWPERAWKPAVPASDPALPLRHRFGQQAEDLPHHGDTDERGVAAHVEG